MPKSESSVIHFFLRLLCRGGQGRRSEEEKKGLAFVSLCRKAPLSLPAFAFSPLAGTKVLCSDVPEAETDRGPRERRVTPPEKREGEKEAAREGSHARATKPPRSHWLERAKFCSGTARLALSSPRFPRGHVSHMNLFPLHRLNTNNRAVRRSFFFFFFWEATPPIVVVRYSVQLSSFWKRLFSRERDMHHPLHVGGVSSTGSMALSKR